MWGGGGQKTGKNILQNQNFIKKNPALQRKKKERFSRLEKKLLHPCWLWKKKHTFTLSPPPPPPFTFLMVHPWPEGSIHCLDLLSYPPKLMLIGDCREIAKWLHDLRSSHSIEGNRLTEGQIIDTMGMVKCYPAQLSPFPTWSTISLPEVSSIILNSPYNFRQVI